MDTIKFDNRTGIKMIAHRGVSGLERENTCPAFLAAGLRSYWGIETDVHVTKDGVCVVYHDNSTKRLCSMDIEIEQSNFEDIKDLLMTDLVSEVPRRDLFIPTLDEYLSICKKYGKMAIIELKGEMNERDVDLVADVVKREDMCEKSVFISFSQQDLLFIRDRFPKAQIQYLMNEATESKLEFAMDNSFDIDINLKGVTPELVERLHEKGIKINAWTVNKSEDAEYLQNCGVDMITTNILE